MLGAKKISYKKIVIQCFIGCIGLCFFCEYLIYYVVLVQCRWPILEPRKADPTITPIAPEERPVYAMFVADTHLLGTRNGHWFDKLRRFFLQREVLEILTKILTCINWNNGAHTSLSPAAPTYYYFYFSKKVDASVLNIGSDCSGFVEWQMYRTFQTAMILHNPDVVFFLGDIFDEGLWCGSVDLENYINRFHSLFAVPQNTRLYIVAGNHDMGFHYVITPYLNQRFVDGLKAPNVKRITIRGNHFVLLNSMALEGDGCFLCRPTEIAVNKIAKQLKCAKGIGSNCATGNSIRQYSRPIILQHYPMYRESDAMCNELDEAPADIKDIKFRERWECLSKEASEQLLDILNPRLIVDGHTHHGCRKIHGDDILEITIPSFSWRNKDNPSFLLGVFTPNNYAHSKCYMPVESTVIRIYVIGAVCIVIYPMLKIRQRMNRHSFLKLH